MYDTSIVPVTPIPKAPAPNVPISEGGLLPLPGAPSHSYPTRSKTRSQVTAHMRCLAACATDIDHHSHVDFGNLFYLGVNDQAMPDVKSGVEHNHYEMFAHALRINRMNYKDDPSIPRFFYQAMQHQPWIVSVNKEQTNLEKHCTFWIEDDTGQPRIPLMWIFEIKDDGTLKSRLVGRGDMMKAGVHYQDGETYCGNVNAASIKIVLKLAAMLNLEMIGGDIEGAYLITRTKTPIAVHTPEGYYCPPGKVYMVYGNLYGLATAGNTFSTSFDECVTAAGFTSSPWDPKCFWKWHPDDKVTIIMAHSDDFRCFYDPAHKDEYTTFSGLLEKKNYKIKITTDKPFVGIQISRDADGNYYMDQAFFKRQIGKLAKLENLKSPPQIPHFCEELPLTAQDGLSFVEDTLTPAQVAEVKLFPYRTIIGSIQYVQVHTGITTMYATSVLSRFTNDPGPRHIKYAQRLVAYLVGSADDRLVFRRLPFTMSRTLPIKELQLSFYVDADLAGQTGRHSQECYIALLGGDVVAYASHRQTTISTGTMESEVKAICTVAKCEVVHQRKLLEAIGFAQAPSVIYEDNSAVTTVSKTGHLAKGMRHLPLWLTWIQELQHDGIINTEVVKSSENLADLGTKYLDKLTFIGLSRRLVDTTITAQKFPKNFK